MKKSRVLPYISVLLVLFLAFVPAAAEESAQPGPAPVNEKKITLDFNNVDLPVLVKFFSELTGKNFIIDEKVRGKVTVFSPTKMTIAKAYEVFLSVLDMKGFTTVQSGDVIQILPAGEVPVERSIRLVSLANSAAEDISRTLSTFLARPAGQTLHPKMRPEADFEGQVQVFPDKAANTLIVYSSQKDFEIVRDIIQKLDVRKKQVFVEAVIMEVAVSKLRTMGIELANLNPNNGVVGATNFGQIVNLANNGPSALSDSSGLAVAGGGGVVPNPFSPTGNLLDIKGLLTALQSDSDVNVLSTPQILATNFQKARIVVGQNVPFPTGSSQTTGGLVQRTIDRKDVGVSLEMTPEVLEDKRVKLDIHQEISTVVDTPQALLVDLGPTTNKREATTSVVVGDRETIVIGGLIRDDFVKSENKVPFLGDIPVLGWLFKYQSRKIDKTNLMIFLTPSIIREADEVQALENNKARAMDEFIEKNKMEKPEMSRQEIIHGQINLPPQN